MVGFVFQGDPVHIKRPNGDTVDPGASAGTKVEIIPVVDISGAISAGEIIFDFIAFEALSEAGRISMVQDLLLTDKEDNAGWSLTLIWADSLLDLGVLNATPTITDADSFKILGVTTFATTDWIDLGGDKIAYKANIGTILEAASSTQCYVAGFVTAGGTGVTFTNASSLQVRTGILQG
jgi:hypothetical protein